MAFRKAVLLLAICGVLPNLYSSDWTRFRGPNGSGISPDSELPPTSWSESENLRWKKELPGPGLSCPVVIRDRILITCWTGYAAGGEDQGAIENLKRNLLCIDRATGDIIWTKAEDAVLPEDDYRGMFAQNGYASHTPATDGERVYVFYGKTGVLAYDLGDGEKLWQQSVGENRERRGWGSASSPIVHDGKVIVPAFIEGDALVALDAKTGKTVWQQKVDGYTSNWSTPILVEANGQMDLVLAVPGEVWGINPDNGKLRWYCEVPGSDDARASVVADGSLVIAMAGGRGARTSIAVQAGGKGEVKPVWQGSDSSAISTPVIHNGRVYAVNNKVATSIDLTNGKRIAQFRLTGSGGGGSDAAASEGDERRPGGGEGEGGRGGGGGGGRGGFGGRGGGMGGQDYSSPVAAGDHLYYTARSGDVFVVEMGQEMKQVARNKFESDSGEWNSTPAISNGEMFIRSTTALYCISAGK